VFVAAACGRYPGRESETCARRKSVSRTSKSGRDEQTRLTKKNAGEDLPASFRNASTLAMSLLSLWYIARTGIAQARIVLPINRIMAAEKTTGIVLRVIEFSETSCIVKLMTRDHGKITAIAKGARRPKSSFEAALDVLAICRIVFLHKTSGAMSLLTEAKLERRFRSSATNLKRLYAGYYVAELLNLMTDEGDPHPELFEHAIEMIGEIDSTDNDDNQLNLKLLKFELKMLAALGHLPMLTKCVGCGKEKTTLTKVNFGFSAGGILCQDCRRGQSEIVILSPDGFQFLLSLVGGQIGASRLNSDNWNQPERVQETKIANSEWIEQVDASLKDTQTPDTNLRRCEFEIRQLIKKYITHLLGFEPKLHKFLQNI